MKINDVGRIGAIQAYQKTNKTKASNKAEAKRDELQISKTAQELLKVQKNDILNPAARSEKVERLKEQVDNGTYNVESKAIAEKMLKPKTGIFYE
ncbi:flagellar biosynthesis anti-sigma factor FlgM [Desulfuribacillus alkaliarsenatis]|uniref:Negative regulator of flagellin synthesis n=1 Tax=Desulfuribacillus alkaliarsenatis TaxID=766136 RepID=A0A1E5G4U8_9FIRM|nr:flagellar biosynthesis anti-sigma factor FlgM [Desulfuribacillus alkaliarsenatis]OEF97704.1 flagellar biosynthesis anti-sigma factor FlgM [Desulfuribacillus alkaliarsenatis]